MNNKDQTIEAINRYLANHKLQLDLQIDFPQYRIKPLEVELALKVLFAHGMVFKLSLKDVK